MMFASPAAALVVLVAALLLLVAAARGIGARRSPSAPLHRLSWGQLGAGLGLAAVAVLVAPATPAPAFLLAASVAGLCTVAAIGVGTEIGGAFATAGFMLPALRRVEAGSPGSASAEGMLAAAAVALVLAALAQRLGLIGPGDAGLVLLAAVAARLLERHLRPAVGGGRALVAATTIGAALGALLVVLLP